MEKMTLRISGILGLLLTCVSLSGCITTSGAAFGAASGAMAARGVGNDFKYYVFDVPPQVIYRIDDHRFFTLENYKDCGHGGLAYYNDTKKKIKEYVGGGSDSNSLLKPNPLISWKGQFIYAASDNVIAYIFRRQLMSDRDTHSGVFLSYRIDGESGGIQVGSDSEPGIGTTIIVSDNQAYVKTGSARGLRFNYPKYNERARDAHIVENKDWPQSRTPSGDFRFVCDYTIRPENFFVTPEQIYAKDATGVPVHDR